MDARSDDEAAIVRLIHAHRIAIWTNDFEAWAKCFVHAPYTTRWGWWQVGGPFFRQGWDNIEERVKRDHPPRNDAFAFETKVEDLTIRVSGDMAWAVYVQHKPGYGIPGHIGPGMTHEARIFERHDGEWRIAFLGFLDANAGKADTALIRVTGEGAVTWTSEAAAQMLTDSDDLVVRNGRLRFRDGRVDSKFRAALRWAEALDDGLESKRGAVPIVVEAGEGEAVRIYWVMVEAGMIMFSFGDPRLAEDRLDMAAVVFGLSTAQKRVAVLIAEGKTLTEIASITGVSANTARTHLSRIFDKTGVRTQPALVRMLLSVVAPY